MRVGIDTYTFHRRFGEVRPSEQPVDAGWTTRDVIGRCSQMGVDGVSLETCYLEGTSRRHLRELKAMLDDAQLDRVLAWGHPGGLEMGVSPQRRSDAIDAVDQAAAIDAELLRIVVGTTRHFGAEDEEIVVERLGPQVREIVDRGADRGVPVAIETHCDLTVAGLASLIENVDRSDLGVVLDTANVVRIGDDVVRVAEMLAARTLMLHVKDLDLAASAAPGDPGGWWPCVPLGTGDLDLVRVLEIVHDAGFCGLACVEVADVPAGVDEEQLAEESVRWLRSTGIRSKVRGG